MRVQQRWKLHLVRLSALTQQTAEGWRRSVGYTCLDADRYSASDHLPPAGLAWTLTGLGAGGCERHLFRDRSSFTRPVLAVREKGPNAPQSTGRGGSTIRMPVTLLRLETKRFPEARFGGRVPVHVRVPTHRPIARGNTDLRQDRRRCKGKSGGLAAGRSLLPCGSCRGCLAYCGRCAASRFDSFHSLSSLQYPQ